MLPGSGTAVIRSTGRAASPAWSPDGSKIAFISDQSGADEVWVSDASGGNPRQATHFAMNGQPANPRWSPDGSKLLCQVYGLGDPVIYVVPLGGGQPKRLVTGRFGSWSHDGASVYYSQSAGIWKAPVSGGEPVRLTRNRAGGLMPEESADGKYVYFRQWRSVWRVPSNGGTEEEFFQPERDMNWSPLQPFADGAYFMARDHDKRMLVFYEFTTRKSTPVFTAKPGDADFSVSPDRKSVLHSRVDQNETNLMLIENFK
jgi:TolB protein